MSRNKNKSKSIEDKSNMGKILNQVNKKKEEDVWENESYNVLDIVSFFIPLDVQLTLLALNEKFSSIEFSIFGKAHWNPDDNGFNMDPQTFVPKQSASAASIDIKEDNLEYNVVIHKHPNGCNNFSKTDEDYINSNFEFSILWESKKFCKASGKIWVPSFNSFIRINIDPILYGLEEYLPDNYKNIEEIKYKYKPSKGHSSIHTGYYGGPHLPPASPLEGPHDAQSFVKESWKRNLKENTLPDEEDELKDFFDMISDEIIIPFTKKEIKTLEDNGYKIDDDGDLLDKDEYIVYTNDELITIDNQEFWESLEIKKSPIHSVPLSKDL